MIAQSCLLICLASTLGLVGLIWFVQMVHYPLLGQVGPGSFGPYHVEHVRRTGPVVAPFMVAELLSSLALVPLRPPGVTLGLALIGLTLAGVTWLSTALVQVPLHHCLSTSFDPEVHASLIRTNWFRTAAWTGHGLVVLAMVARAIH